MGSSRVERSWRWRHGGTRGQDGVGSSTEAVWRGDAAAARARVPSASLSSLFEETVTLASVAFGFGKAFPDTVSYVGSVIFVTFRFKSR